MTKMLEVALPANDALGEGPWWSVAEDALWRVDILGHQVFRWDPASGTSDTWEVAEDVGFALPAEPGKIIAGMRSGIHLVELATGAQSELAATPGGPGRFNDGKTDRAGRIWAGTIVDDHDCDGGEFGMLGDDGFQTALTGVTISNGLGWSPDEQTMYFTDSAAKTIWAFEYDAEEASMHNRRVFAIDKDGAPDGLTVDSEGGVWSAKWDGNRIVRYDADGSVSQVVDSPVSRPTSCMFGGTELDTLYVTSARAGLADAELTATPAGSVLAFQPGVRGIAETPPVFSADW